MDPSAVATIFKRLRTKNSSGPDGISALLLKTCADELTPAWSPLFELSLDAVIIPIIWKKQSLPLIQINIGH